MTATFSDQSDWMGNLPTSVASKPLKDLAIPGSHNCGAYYVDISLPIGPDQSSTIRSLDCCCCVKPILRNWSLTQNLTFTNQLKVGVRYFDMRSAYLDSENEILFLHGLYGPKIFDLLAEINEFLNTHPDEVVILDFNRYYDFTADTHTRLVNNILTTFQGKLYPPTNGLASSLQDIRSASKQVLIVYAADQYINPVFWPLSNVNKTFARTSEIPDLISYLDQVLMSTNPNTFNIYQSILTPDTGTIAGNLCGSLETSLSREANNAIKPLDNVKSVGNISVNIFTLDFVELGNCVPSILALNELLV